MTTITLKINEKSKVGKALLSFIEVFSNESKSVEVIKKPNKETLKVIDDIENMKNITTAKNVEDLMKKLRA